MKKKNNNRNEYIAVLIAGLVFAGFGIFQLTYTLSNLGKCLASKNWQPAEAVVQSSKLQTKWISGGGGKRSAGGRMGYTIAITYQYSVGDEEYIGDRYDFFRSKDQYSSAGEDEKQKIVRNHPAGKTVTCFVNPDNPDEAVICREADTMVVIFSFFPLLFIAAGAGIIIFSVKKLLPPGKQKQ